MYAFLEEQYAKLQALRAKISEALDDFSDKGVEVYYKNGLVYVSLQESLLYKPGSSALGEKGKKALGVLANALKDYPDLKVIVLGNTDNVMYKKGGSMDNLSLSTDRANGVVRLFVGEYKINPERLTSAGKGKYNPIADTIRLKEEQKTGAPKLYLIPTWINCGKAFSISRIFIVRTGVYYSGRTAS